MFSTCSQYYIYVILYISCSTFELQIWGFHYKDVGNVSRAGRISSFIVSNCKIFPYFCQYFPTLISNPVQEVFFWRFGVGINQINWIVWSLEQPAMNQIFPFFAHFCARSLGYLLQLVSKYKSFYRNKNAAGWEKFSFQFRSRAARWISTGRDTTGLTSITNPSWILIASLPDVASP